MFIIKRNRLEAVTSDTRKRSSLSLSLVFVPPPRQECSSPGVAPRELTGARMQSQSPLGTRKTQIKIKEIDNTNHINKTLQLGHSEISSDPDDYNGKPCLHISGACTCFIGPLPVISRLTS